MFLTGNKEIVTLASSFGFLKVKFDDIIPMLDTVFRIVRLTKLLPFSALKTGISENVYKD